MMEPGFSSPGDISKYEEIIKITQPLSGGGACVPLPGCADEFEFWHDNCSLTMPLNYSYRFQEGSVAT